MIQSIDCGTFDTETTQDVTRPKRTRIRKRSIQIQIQEIMNSCAELDKAPVNDFTIAQMKFQQARLKTLTLLQARERHDKLKRAEKEVERLTAENVRLREQVNQLAAKPAARPLTPAELILANYEAEKAGGKTL